MPHTTLASTDRALEKIGDFVGVQDYPSLKAVGRTFAQKAAVIVGFQRSIPKRYAKKAKRRLPAVNSHAKALGSLAEPYLLRALREDSTQGVRGAAAQWLAHIARRSDEDVRVRVYGVEPFPVGSTVELHGLHPTISNFVLNGRHVVVVPTPLDVAARGRINVVIDGAVHAVRREKLRAVATP